MHRRTLPFGILALLLACAARAQTESQHEHADPRRPRLVVVIVVDQMRADYLERFSAGFRTPGEGEGPGGFRWLMEHGAWFRSAAYRHFPLFTGPGHAVVLTGGDPYQTGIVSNLWLSTAPTPAMVYCVDDPSVKTVGGEAKPASPANLRSTTVGDELELATNRAAKVASIALKDRSAILLAGRLADACVWFDESKGNWISSSFYCRDGALPDWVKDLNERRIPDFFKDTAWEIGPIASKLAGGAVTTKLPSWVAKQLGADYPRRIDGAQRYYKAFTRMPFANQYVIETAERAVDGLGLGQDDVPDLLAISLSTNDYIGHLFGPDSPQVADVTLQTDTQLAALFTFLARRVPGGLGSVTVALTADHGVCPIPEPMRALGYDAGRLVISDIARTVDAALAAADGGANGDSGKWVLGFDEAYLYLDPKRCAASKLDARALQDVAARAVAGMHGIFAAYPRHRIEDRALPETDLAARIYRGFDPTRSGDVVIVPAPFWLLEGSEYEDTTSHGSPFAYDTHVPLLLAGCGIQAGVFDRDVGPVDLAPTLCALLGVARPSACEGTVLEEALAR